MSYAKIDQPHLRKLDDRSRMLVHLGTEPWSKAYRLLDPQIRKTILSRDVIFDETKSWNWRQNQPGQDDDGSFSITLGEFGNHGIGIQKEINHEETESLETDTDEQRSNEHETCNDNDLPEIP